MSALTLQSMTVKLGGRNVVQDVSLTIQPGECVGLIGPNGAGKSTLLRAALGLIPSSSHSSLANISREERARIAGWLPQQREIAWDLEVASVVALGRIPYRRLGIALSKSDSEAIAKAMTEADITKFAERRMGELSGGEQARVLLARVLAQDAQIILADEPVAALDPAHQIATMETFKAYAKNGRTVITALHDLGLAACWCSRLILLNEGHVIADGVPSEVLTTQHLRTVYGVDAYLADSPDGMIVQPTRRVDL